MKNKLLTIITDERGATMLEYGFIVAVMGGVIVGSLALLGGDIAASFSEGLTPMLTERLSETQSR